MAKIATKISTICQMILGEVMVPDKTLKGTITFKKLMLIFLERNFKLDSQ